MVAISIGAEVDYYTADGPFSEYQKSIYSAVLKAQKLGIKEAKIGSTMTTIESKILDSLGDVLLEMELIDKKVKEQIFVYYPHGFGHGLGLDVHDKVSN